MKNALIFILISFILSARETSKIARFKTYLIEGKFLPEQSSKNKKVAIEAVRMTRKELRNKYSLECAGFGAGGDYERLSLDFNFHAPLKKDAARNLLIQSAKTFEKNYNSSIEKVESLKKYPAAITIHDLLPKN